MGRHIINETNRRARFAAKSASEAVKAAFASGDGAHCGLGDWYPEKEKALARAIRSGKPFDTGWYGSKKEIASARIYSDGKTVQVEASVSDDFDTPGMGIAQVFGAAPVSLEQVREAIYRAWDEANDNQSDNRMYVGFSILRRTIRYGMYSGGKPVGKGHRAESWVETLILPTGESELFDSPPGDNYHKWGFQGEEPIPAKVKEKLEDWARDYSYGNAKGDKLTVQKWTIKPWENDQSE